jgi:uncharacterized protein YjbI with pentapeptide repeats
VELKVKGQGEHDYSKYSRDAYDQLLVKEKASIKQAHLDRAAQGKEAWNEWAKEFEKEINNAGIEYVIDFTKIDVPEAVSFAGFIFPCVTNFIETVISGDADFIEAQFCGDVYFIDAQFNGGASFSKAQFSGGADFIEAQFCGDASFSEAQFSGRANFIKTQFNGRAKFIKAQFIGGASFSEAQFSGGACFNDANYKGVASYVSANFKDEVMLENTVFGQVPNFSFATFNQPPQLSSISIAEPADKSEKGLVERYRTIKKLAIKSNDFQSVLSFFGLEAHAKAYLETTPRSERAFIKAYKLLSDFGQSIVRPLFALLVFFTAMCVINGGYIAMSNPLSKNCVAHKLEYASAVVQYTFSQASPVFNVEAERAKEIEECLFQKNSLDTRNIIWRLAHLLPTTLLLLIFGLAVRNRFKIR